MSSDNGRTMTERDRSLYRDTSDKMVAGVCSGLGRDFDIHTQVVRVAFVVFTLLGGAGVLAYLVLWFALDPDPTGRRLEKRTDSAVLPEDHTEPGMAETLAGRISGTLTLVAVERVGILLIFR